MVILVISVISLSIPSINTIKKPLGLSVCFSYIQMLFIVSEAADSIPLGNRWSEILRVNKGCWLAELLFKFLIKKKNTTKQSKKLV